MKRYAMTKNSDQQYDQSATGNLIPNPNKTTCLFLNVYFSPWKKKHFLQLFQHFVVDPNPSLPSTD